MSQREFLVLAFILYILIVQFAAARLYRDEKEDSSDVDDEYHLLKRFLFHHSTTGSTTKKPSVLENLVHPSSTRKPTIWTQKTTYSPFYPSSSACSSIPCEHGGICIPKGQLTFECKCVGPWRGIYCGVADACYRSPCQNGGTCLNAHDDYWCQCTSEYYGTNCQTKFYSPSYSENNCRSGICNTGRCVSLQTTYYCQCPVDRYGEHCEKIFYKRTVSSYQSYRDLMHQLKRNMLKKNVRYTHNSQRGEDVAHYDVMNGIYF